MKIIVSGGGTGGHIYPALAILHEVKNHYPDAEVLYIGAENGLEQTIVAKENIPFKSLVITGFKRKISFENVKTIYRFLKGVSKSKKWMKAFKPDVVIGTGGYVCGPVVYAAAKLGIPTIIHEQNSIPGLTNKFLSRYTSKIAISLKASEIFFPKGKVVLTGNPRATEVVRMAQSNASASNLSSEKTVLIVGGSRGAKPINDAAIALLPHLKDRTYKVIYVTGDAHYENVKKSIEPYRSLSNLSVRPFIHNMPEVLRNVDLAVGRAGATFISEWTALGIPSILIPSPYVTNNHQEKNAQAMAEKNASIMIKEKECTGPKLIQTIDEIMLNKSKWDGMHQAALSEGIPDASTKMMALIEDLIGKKGDT